MKTRTTLRSKLGTLLLISSGASLGLGILVEPELGDHHLGRVDPNVDGGAVHLLTGDALDVDHPLAPVDLSHLPFSSRCTWSAGRLRAVRS